MNPITHMRCAGERVPTTCPYVTYPRVIDRKPISKNLVSKMRRPVKQEIKICITIPGHVEAFLIIALWLFKIILFVRGVRGLEILTRFQARSAVFQALRSLFRGPLRNHVIQAARSFQRVSEYRWLSPASLRIHNTTVHLSKQLNQDFVIDV